MKTIKLCKAICLALTIILFSASDAVAQARMAKSGGMFNGAYVSVSGGGVLSSAKNMQENFDEAGFSSAFAVGYGHVLGSNIYVGGATRIVINTVSFNSSGGKSESDYIWGAHGHVGYVVAPDSLLLLAVGFERVKVDFTASNTQLRNDSADLDTFSIGFEAIQHMPEFDGAFVKVSYYVNTGDKGMLSGQPFELEDSHSFYVGVGYRF